jgi:hypothetical protein
MEASRQSKKAKVVERGHIETEANVVYTVVSHKEEARNASFDGGDSLWAYCC